MELARDIFNSPKGKLYIDVTDSNGALTEGFKELLDAAFDIGKYAAGNSFAGRVLQNGDGDFVVQIAAEAHNGDDGAAEIMTFSGVLAEAMHEHVTSISVADEFDAAAAVGDDFAFALDANYVESNSNKKGVSIIVQGDYDGDQVLRVINWDSYAKDDVIITSNGGEETDAFDLPADSQVFVRMGDAQDGTSYFLEGKSATSGSEIYDQPWDLTAIAADTSFDFLG